VLADTIDHKSPASVGHLVVKSLAKHNGNYRAACTMDNAKYVDASRPVAGRSYSLMTA
jgi:hypothetical protein